jgi:BioD-like phosphotransacetylase family protein
MVLLVVILCNPLAHLTGYHPYDRVIGVIFVEAPAKEVDRDRSFLQSVFGSLQRRSYNVLEERGVSRAVAKQMTGEKLLTLFKN